MFGWRLDSDKEEEVEVTWSEFTQLYLEVLKCVHVSEYDHEEKPCKYLNVPSQPLAKIINDQFGIKTNGVQESDDSEAAVENGQSEPDDKPALPITILTCFFWQTHKGTDNCY